MRKKGEEMDSRDSVSLKVAGRSYVGWTNVSVVTDLKSLFRSFSVSGSRRIDGSGVAKVDFHVGDSVEVFIGADKVITGLVTKVDVVYKSSSVSITVQGMGRLWAMCTSALPPGVPRSYENMSLPRLLETIAGPFGVQVVSNVQVLDKESMSFSSEDTVEEKLKSFLKRKSFLLTESEDGRLVIEKAQGAGSTYESLESGKNILSGQRTDDAQGLYSQYVVYGQGTNPDSVRGVSDNQLRRRLYGSFGVVRVLAKKQTGNATQTDVDARASLIHAYSEGSVTKLVYTVRGFRQSNGDLWIPNQMVTVKDSLLDIDGKYLIIGVAYEISSTGSTTKLTLQSPLALLPTELESAEQKAKASTVASNLNSIGQVGSADWTRA